MECQYPTYKLSGAVLQGYLRYTFQDNSIRVEPRNGNFVFTLPVGRELTEDNRKQIKELRGETKWKIPS
ncbi:hypothetical protein CEP53_000902 [Fusarium sp. AF-6]|nr:hypothetical protein CEP53_000902 [Fusarium sp. AF-6]